MEDLTFGEQVKIMLSRKGMTIKELAETIQARTGKPMSRQNLTQRLGRDNFQEQDMRMIAAILECPFHLSIFSLEGDEEQERSIEDPMLKYAARALANKKAAKKQEEPEPEVYQQELVFDESPVVVQDEVKEEPAEEAAVTEEETAAEETVAAEEEAVAEEEEAAAEEAAAAESEEASVEEAEEVQEEAPSEEVSEEERDMTIGELYEIHEELDEIEEGVQAGEPIEAVKKELEKPLIQPEPQAKKGFRTSGILRRMGFAPKEKKSEEIKEEIKAEEKKAAPAQKVKEQTTFEPVIKHEDEQEDLTVGEVNPYTGHEYQSNSVRMHPSRIGYVQVYDRKDHKWTDMTEWAFLGYQERKKALLKKDYEPPIYLD